jgi:hypothetical protein
MLIGIRHRARRRSPVPLGDTACIAGRPGRISFFESSTVVGHGRIISGLKIAFAAHFDFSVDIDNARLDEIIFPFLDEFIIGAFVVRAPRNSGISSTKRRHWRAIRIGRRRALVVMVRWPRAIDIQFGLLQLGQWRALQPFIHNRLCHRLLQRIAMLRQAKTGSRNAGPHTGRIVLQSAKVPQDAVISLVDSSSPDTYRSYVSTVRYALHRFGIPFQEIDVAGAAISIASLPPSPLTVVGQQGVLRSVIADEAAEPARILNFDYTSVASQDSARLFTELTKVEAREARVGGVKLVFDDPVAFQVARHGRGSAITLAGGACPYFADGTGTFHCFFDQAAAMRSRSGGPNEVSFLVQAAILELCTQPIDVRPCPRFLMLKLDDVTLKDSAAHLVEIARTGVHTNVGLFLNDVPLEAITDELRNNTRLSFAPHAAGWKHSYWRDVINSVDYAAEDLRRSVEHIAGHFAARGIAISPVANLHFYALQRGATPFLSELGIHTSIMYGRGSRHPAHLQSYQSGWDDAGIFRMSAEDHSSFRYHLNNTWDILKRCANPDGTGNVEKAIARGFDAARKAFVAGCPAILSTHEFRMLRFRPGQMREVIGGILDRLENEHLTPILRSDEAIAEYLETAERGALNETGTARDEVILRGERSPHVALSCQLYNSDPADREVTLASESAAVPRRPLL